MTAFRGAGPLAGARSYGVSWGLLGAGAASILLGAAVGAGFATISAGVLVGAAALAVGILNWRWSIYGLLAYLPFSGIPTIVLYPATTPGVLAKDFLFVVPAYAGFFAWWVFRRQRVEVPGVPLILLALFVSLVLMQMLNPSLPNRVTGLIGVKVWLFYIPLLFLGYHLVDTKAQILRVLGLMSVAAVPPALIGLAEAGLIYGGQEQAVYGLYGDAAGAVTQSFAELSFEGGSIRRVPSTFSFVAQYFTFTMSMIAVAYAWWRGALAGTRFAWIGVTLWTLILVACFSSGARSAFLFVPILIGLILVLDRGGITASWRAIAVSAGALVAAVSIVGVSISALAGHSRDVLVVEFGELIIDGFPRALALTLGGLGSGADTNASRYAYSQPELFRGIDGTWFESWWVKSLLELGIAGLVLVGLFFGALVLEAGRRHFRLRDPQLRAVSAAILALLVTTLLANIKGPYIDFDPLNVYFWFLGGILFKVSVIDAASSEPANDDDHR